MKRLIFLCMFSLPFVFWSSAQYTNTVVINFDFDKSELRESSTEMLDSIGKFLDGKKDYKIIIRGHTDSIGNLAYNQQLSDRRSEAAMKYLTRYNIPENCVVIENFGETKPVSDSYNDDGCLANRRVELSIHFKKEDDKRMIILGDKPGYSPGQLKWRSDTIIFGNYGCEVIIPKDAFEPYSIEEIDFKITEIFTPCDMLAHGINTVTETGDCLTSAGMIFLDARIDTMKVTLKKTIEIRIPAYSVDKDMQLYEATISRKKEVKWKPIDKRLEFDESTKQSYYVFKTDILTGFNIDKMICPGCMLNQIAIKTKGFDKSDVYLTNPGRSILNTGILYKKRKYKLPDPSGDSPLLIVMTNIRGNDYITKKKLEDLPFRKNKNMYIVKKQDLVPLEKNERGLSYTKEDICKMLIY